MAVAFDASTNGTVNTSTTLTFSHTTSGSNRALGVGVCGNNSVDPSGVTYAGVAMAKEHTQPLVDDADVVTMWELEAPASGANNVVVTQASGSWGMRACAFSVTGADQTDCISNHSGAHNSGSTTPSTTCTSAADELVFATCGALGTPTTTVGAGETEVQDVATAGCISAHSFYEAGAASVTISPTLSTSNEWSIIAMSFKAVAAGGVTLHNLTLLGAGQ